MHNYIQLSKTGNNLKNISLKDCVNRNINHKMNQDYLYFYMPSLFYKKV